MEDERTDDNDEVIIAVSASIGRRWLGVLSLGAVGLLLLALAFETGGLARILFLAAALTAIWGAERLRRATLDRLELTRSELRTASGRCLARVANVRAVERGAFAFKPSHGFLVRLKEPQGRGWAPGLWWQRGRLLGVGGVLPGGQTRAMADLLSGLVKGTLPDKE